ncbi:MAG: glycosyltransferase [Pseudomonadota bacterium]
MRDLAKPDLSVSVFEGSVYVASSKNIDPSHHFLRFGSNTIPLLSASEKDLPPVPSIQSIAEGLSSGADRFKCSKPNAINAGSNIETAWTLEGFDTNYIEILDWAHRTEIVICPHGSPYIEVDERPLSVSGFFATHRGQVTLVVECLDAGYDLISSKSRKIDDAFEGGQSHAGYDAIELGFPWDAKRRFVRLKLVYEANRDDPGVSPYIFFADCTLMSRSDGGGRLSKSLDVGRKSADTDYSRLKCDLPETLYWGKTTKLLFEGPETETCIFEFQTSDVTIALKEGRHLFVSSPIRLDLLIYIDGQVLNSVDVISDDVMTLVPNRYLDGRIHHVIVRDAYGIAIIAEEYFFFDCIEVPAHTLRQITRRPIPSYLDSNSRFRYLALQRHLEHGAHYTDAQRAQLTWAHEAVCMGAEDLHAVKPLAFERVKNPDVSVVIPVHNQFHYTYTCLCALLLAYNHASFEVILVDDGSDDRTTEIEELVTGIKLVRHEDAQQFIAACNAGAALADGRFIVLLNNDTEPTSGWLDELVSVFGQFENVGLAGSKLLNTDGTLQEAGGIVWQNGNPSNYGWNGNPWDPKYCYTRQADFLSGAAIMVSRKAWDEVGGLSTYYEKMYFEDTDLAFKVRDAGYKTIFAPHSLVYHFNGQTAGTDETEGFKRYQEINRPTFKKKWAADFIEHGPEGGDPDLEKDRGILGRVLVIDHAAPRTDNDAGGHAVTQEMRLLRSLGFKVTLLPSNLAFLGRYTEDLNKLGIETLYRPFVSSLEDYIQECAADYDLFYVLRYQIAETVVPLIREANPDAKIMFNGVDLHFLREVRAAIASGSQEDMEQAIKTRDRELVVMRSCDLALSYNDSEHAVVLSHNLDNGAIAKCPWVVSKKENRVRFKSRSGIAFLGGYGHPPNAEAMEFFAKDVMPLFKDTLPDMVLSIYGSQMPDTIKALESETIAPVGFVDHVSDVYFKHRVFVAPLLSGAGLKGKVVDALAHGIPSVLSPVAAESVGVRHGYDCLIAQTPEDWVDCIGRLYSDAKLWSKISRNGQSLIDEAYSFEAGRETLSRALKQLGFLDGVNLDEVGLV